MAAELGVWNQLLHIFTMKNQITHKKENWGRRTHIYFPSQDPFRDKLCLGKNVTVVAQECGSLQYPKGVVHTRLGWHRIIGHADKSARPLRERRQNGESGSPYTTAQERLTRRLVGRHETSVITERFEQSAPMSLCFSIFQRYGTRRQSCRVHLLQN